MSQHSWLAIDASSNVCEVGISTKHGERVRQATQAGSHARDLMALLDDVLRSEDIDVSALDGVVYGCGPGSFTGVRIGIALAQGLAHAANLPMLPVSSLRNIAQQVLPDVPSESAFWVAVDARMGEWYVGQFRRGADDVANAVGDELLVRPEHWLAQLPSRTVVVAAMDSAAPEHVELARTCALQWSRQALTPSASTALLLAQYAHVDAWHTPQEAMASYIRNKVAQTMAERQPS